MIPATPLLDWHEAGLPKATAFKPVLSTIETNLVLKKIGKLSAMDEKALRNILSQILG